MKTRTTIILGVALLLAAPDASGQSLKDGLKRIGDQIGKTVKQTVQQTTKQSTKQTTTKTSGQTDKDKQLQKQYEAMLGPGVGNAEDEAPTARLPEQNTALLAPLGYPIEARYGVKRAKAEMPPREAEKQVDWTGNRPWISDLDNQSLVEEYLLLDECVENGYIKPLTPAHQHYQNVKEEVFARTDALNGLVEYYNEAKDEYKSKLGDETYNWVINGIHDKLATILDGVPYKTVIRSSLVPLFTQVGNFIKPETKAYFEAHGGYENAISVEWTKWDPNPNKQKFSTSVQGQTATVIEEVKAGATVDIGGIAYVLHSGSNGGDGRAFLSEVAKTAVAGKDIVIPDYIEYKGNKYPVLDMRAEVFYGTTIKSVKLPNTLTELSNAAFRGTPITEIVIPASVKKVQGSVFQDCKNLAKVVFEGDSVDELSGCFQNCTSLRSIKLPRRVKDRMSYSMFEGCVNLTEVTLPENITELPASTFDGCKNLKTIVIPSSVKKVDSHAFAGCGVVSLDLSNVTEFGDFCFNDCNSLKSVKLNSKFKEDFLMELYPEFMECPLLQIKWANGQYIYPEGGFIFVDGK